MKLYCPSKHVYIFRQYLYVQAIIAINRILSRYVALSVDAYIFNYFFWEFRPSGLVVALNCYIVTSVGL